MAKGPSEVDRALDDLVPEYRPRAEGGALKRHVRRVAKFLVAAILAVAAMCVIFYILHRHVRDAQTAPAPKKPVVIRIIPVQK